MCWACAPCTFRQAPQAHDASCSCPHSTHAHAHTSCIRALASFEQLLASKASCLAHPDILISAVGTKVYLFTPEGRWNEDKAWSSQLDQGWNVGAVREAAYSALAKVGCWVDLPSRRCHARPHAPCAWLIIFTPHARFCRTPLRTDLHLCHRWARIPCTSGLLRSRMSTRSPAALTHQCCSRRVGCRQTWWLGGVAGWGKGGKREVLAPLPGSFKHRSVRHRCLCAAAGRCTAGRHGVLAAQVWRRATPQPTPSAPSASLPARPSLSASGAGAISH